MQQLFTNGFLLALGKAIASSIWQMGLLFLLYQFIVAVFKIKQPAARNLLSTIFSLGGFVWFTFSFVQFIFKTPTASVVIEKGVVNNQLLQQFAGSNQWQLLLNWVEYKFNLLLPYLSIAYLFVLLWFAAKLLFQVQQTNQLRKTGVQQAGIELQQLVQTLATNLGLTKNIITLISNKMDIPATIGFLKPVILLPVTAVTHLSAAQLEAVLLHELAHIRRNDYFWNLLLSITETLLFFNPFALMLISIARKERENSCDDVVMQYRHNAAVYAEALLNVEKARLLTPQLAMALGDNKHHLMHRVKRILNMPVEKNKTSTRLLALIFFTFLFALMGWVMQSKKQESKNIAEKKSAPVVSGQQLTLTADALVKNENKTIALRDASKKLNLEIKKNNHKEEYIVLNEEGNRFQFDKLIFEELPVEWMNEMPPVEAQRFPHPSEYTGAVHMYQRNDSLLQEQYKKQYRRENELYQRNTARINRMRTNADQHQNMFMYLRNIPDIDSAMQKFDKSKSYFNFEWNGEMPFVFLREKEALTDKMKQARSGMMRLSELRRKTKEVETRKLKTVDSILQEQNVYFREFAPQWSAIQNEKLQEVLKEHPQLTIIIEGNNVIVNGQHVQIDSSNNNNHQKRKMIRLVEVMKL
jgi:beta-lactamase regulating signal transducer with metallopeptidase domain